MLDRFLARVTDVEIDLDGAVRATSSFQCGDGAMPVVTREVA